MKTNLELVDLLRARANVSYEDAKTALEACDYDIVEALIHLEKKDKLRKTRTERNKNHEKKFKSFCKDLMNIKFLVKKRNDIILNMPLVIVGIFALITLPLTLVLLGAAILTGHRFQIKKGDEIIPVKKVFDDMKDNINDMAHGHDDPTATEEAQETSQARQAYDEA